MPTNILELEMWRAQQRAKRIALNPATTFQYDDQNNEQCDKFIGPDGSPRIVSSGRNNRFKEPFTAAQWEWIRRVKNFNIEQMLDVGVFSHMKRKNISRRLQFCAEEGLLFRTMRGHYSVSPERDSTPNNSHMVSSAGVRGFLPEQIRQIKKLPVITTLYVSALLKISRTAARHKISVACRSGVMIDTGKKIVKHKVFRFSN